MTVSIVQAQFPANGQINLNPAKYFFCFNAPVGGYSFQIWGKSGAENFGQPSSLVAPVGLKVGRVKGWQSAILAGVAGQFISYVYGDEVVAPQDITDILSQIATISGSVVTQINPSATINDDAPISPTVTGQHALFAANGSRRRITVYSDPNNVGDAQVYLRKVGGANDLGFIVPGVYTEFDTTAAMDYRCVNGGDKLYLFEEQ